MAWPAGRCFCHLALSRRVDSCTLCARALSLSLSLSTLVHTLTHTPIKPHSLPRSSLSFLVPPLLFPIQIALSSPSLLFLHSILIRVIDVLPSFSLFFRNHETTSKAAQCDTLSVDCRCGHQHYSYFSKEPTSMPSQHQDPSNPPKQCPSLVTNYTSMEVHPNSS